ncbi:MAG: ComEC/Rec2 family competence protein [Actinomycetota bacterium]
MDDLGNAGNTGTAGNTGNAGGAQADDAVVGDEVLAVVVAAAAWVAAAASPTGLRPWPAAAIGFTAAAVGWWSVGGSRRRAVTVVLVVAGVALVAGHRGAVVSAGYHQRAVGGLPSPVTVLGDAEPVGVAGWRVEFRLPDGGRVEATAFGRAGTELSRAAIGSVVAVEGRLRPVGDRPWLRTRHVEGRATVTDAALVAGPPVWRSAVEAVRHRVAAGADVLSPRSAALYRGLVLGDDRFQPPGQVLRFRLSGLAHLLAVSGQNVAFVLVAAAPLLRRLAPRAQLAGVVVVLVVFALVTRLEPSVLRAVTAAGLSAWAVATGRARSGIGVLAGAVLALVLIDPFLVDAIGFQLSVAASAGILLLSPALRRLLPGPSWLVEPLATSVAAQLAVAPLLAVHFGPVSLVAVPANLAAGWAAAGVMVWGLTAGTVAGLLPDAVASIVQFPVRLALGWLELVAAAGTRLPAPRPHLGAVLGLVVAWLAVRRADPRWPRVGVMLAGVVLVAAAVPQPATAPGACGAGITWYPAARGRSVLQLGADVTLDGVETCRRAGIRSVDLLVVTAGDRSTGRLATALREIVAVGEVWAPPFHAVPGARRRLEPATVATADGWLSVAPEPGGDRLVVTFDAAVAPPSRGGVADGFG